MTRINLVPPIVLCDQHLVAEYREIVRIPTLFWNAYNSEKRIIVPSEFTLGSGHVKFFYDKQRYLEIRFADLVSEMEARNMKPAMHWKTDFVPPEYYLDYTPTKTDYINILNRLDFAVERMKDVPRYNGKPLHKKSVKDMMYSWANEYISDKDYPDIRMDMQNYFLNVNIFTYINQTQINHEKIHS